MNDSTKYIVSFLANRLAELRKETSLPSDFERCSLPRRQQMVRAREGAVRRYKFYEKMLGDWESGRCQLPEVDTNSVESVLAFLGALPMDEGLDYEVRMRHNVSAEVVVYALDHAPIGTTLYFSGLRDWPYRNFLATRIETRYQETGDPVTCWQSEAVLGTPAWFWPGFHTVHYTIELPDPVTGTPRPRPAVMDRSESERLYNIVW